jgi:hypothetical protein
MTAAARSEKLLARYAEHAGIDAVEQLRQLAEPLAGLLWCTSIPPAWEGESPRYSKPWSP